MLRSGTGGVVLSGLLLLAALLGGCEAGATRVPVAALPSPTATASARAIATATCTPSATPTQTPTSTATPTQPPTHTATSTPLPPTATPTLTWTPTSLPPTFTATPNPLPPTATPKPTATPLPRTPTPSPVAYRFLPTGPARPDPSNPCPGCPRAPAYIVGRIMDAGGNPLVGVRLVCYNEWHRYPIVASKVSGEYDFPIIQADTTWYVVVLDQADQPISPVVSIVFRLQESCRYILDWQRLN